MLAMHYMRSGRLAESIDLHEKLLDDLISIHELTPWPMMTLAQACQWAGKLDRADQLLREVLDQVRNHETSRHWRGNRANALGWLSLSLLLKEQYAEAEPLVREALAYYEKELPDTAGRFIWVSQLGAALLGQQQYAEAELLILQGYEGMKQREATQFIEKRRLTEAGERVVRFYDVTNQPDKARAWREKLVAVGRTALDH